MNGGLNELAGLAYLLLGGGFLLRGAHAFLAKTPVKVSGLDLDPDPETGKPLGKPADAPLGKPTATYHQAPIISIESRVGHIQKLIRKRGLDPQIIDRAHRLLQGTAEKDWRAEVHTLFQATRKLVRYTLDPKRADTFSAPQRTLANGGGDCFVKGTLVLKRGHKLVPIESLEVGDEIWGYDRWSRVVNTWEKPTLPTWLIRLNNGSSMRLTPGHKVWIADEIKTRRGYVPNSQRLANLRRVYVRDLRARDVVLQPDSIPFGATFAITCPTPSASPTSAGWWHERYIMVKDPEWARRLGQLGGHAPEKHVSSLDLAAEAATALLRGVMADSGENTSAGRTFTTTSRQLFVQTRVLLKMQGIACGARYIEDHGGLGTHPIYRLQTRERRQDGAVSKLLRVKEIIKDELELPCFDIETDDHFVWLPEADWTVSQCDDYCIVLGSLLESVGHPVRLIVVQTEHADTWSHIFLQTGLPPQKPTEWITLDASVNKPAGWEPPGTSEVLRTGKAAGMIIRARIFPV